MVRVQPRPAEGLTYLVADAGMTELIRPMLYGAVHPVALVEPGARLATDHGRVDLAGPICEAGDILVHDLAQWLSADDWRGPEPARSWPSGRPGPYGAAMASVYNGRLRPAEVVLEGGDLRLSRGRETLDDLVARDA